MVIPEIDVIYFCPDFAGEYIVCVSDDFDRGYFIDDNVLTSQGEWLYPSFRKPNTGMIKYAMDYLIDDAAEEGINADIEECFLVGDRPEDAQCAANANINFCSASLFRLASSKLPDNIVLTDKELQFLVF